MKRIQYHSYGGPEVLQLEDVGLSEPGPGQVRVCVEAAAANPLDWKIRKGELKMMTGGKFPRGLGHDFAGVVDALGPQTTRFKVGDAVFGGTEPKQAGTFSEALLADEKTLFAKPPSLSFEEAAALPIVSATAWAGLIDKAKLQAGQQVFLSGCLGSVGRIAIQIAAMRGAKVVGSCSASRHGEALALGVQEVVDYRTFDPAGDRGRFDVVFDTHGSLSLRQCGGMLKRGGIALHIVPTPLKMFWSMLSSKHQTIFGKVTPNSLTGILDAVERGGLKPTIGRIVPLSDAIPALVELERTGLPSGKLVVTFGSQA